MQIKQIEELLLQEMEEVKGGITTCHCDSGAHQGTATDGNCVCTNGGAAQKLPSGSTCICKGGAGL